MVMSVGNMLYHTSKQGLHVCVGGGSKVGSHMSDGHGIRVGGHREELVVALLVEHPADTTSSSVIEGPTMS